LPLSHGRVYSEQEIWENYTYFVKAVVPVAKEAGVRIGIHPDDPPLPVLAGVPRCIFGNFDGYRRAFEIANSPNIGMCLCSGTWLEGGKYTRKSLLETIQYFGSRRKIFKVTKSERPIRKSFTMTKISAIPYRGRRLPQLLRLAVAQRRVAVHGTNQAQHACGIAGLRASGHRALPPWAGNFLP
jgi:hypothetical protein